MRLVHLQRFPNFACHWLSWLRANSCIFNILTSHSSHASRFFSSQPLFLEMYLIDCNIDLPFSFLFSVRPLRSVRKKERKNVPARWTEMHHHLYLARKDNLLSARGAIVLIIIIQLDDSSYIFIMVWKVTRRYYSGFVLATCSLKFTTYYIM